MCPVTYILERIAVNLKGVQDVFMRGNLEVRISIRCLQSIINLEIHEKPFFYFFSNKNGLVGRWEVKHLTGIAFLHGWKTFYVNQMVFKIAETGVHFI